MVVPRVSRASGLAPRVIKRSISKYDRFVRTAGEYPAGFKVGGVHCGVKKDPSQLDLGLITSDSPCSAAAVFTTNVFKAAPVQISKKVITANEGQGIRSIVINAGNANAVTGDQGLQDAIAMCKAVDGQVGDSGKLSSTLVMSTGVIGQKLPIDKIINGVPQLYQSNLGSDHESWLNVAKAICTTDTFPKLTSRTFSIAGKEYTLSGISKGAGMIHPNMATLLGFLVTDAPVTPAALDSALKYAVDRSYNSISVDGDMSTNDTIAALANGAAGGEPIDVSSPQFEQFRDNLTAIAQELAQLVVRDGEGATKFVTINVEDAPSFEEAKKIAETVATSSLVKTALYGKDANWGRILCAVGYSGIPVSPFKTSVSFIPTDGSPELKLLVNGEPENVDEQRASEILQLEDLEIRVNLGTGQGQRATFWTCDLSHEYVTINADYRS